MIAELAGVIGVNPGPWTLRELVAAATARRAEQWDHTAAMLCLLANANRDPKRQRRPFAVHEFHPWPERVRGRRPRRRPQRSAPVSALRDVFIRGHMPAEAG